jgi:hypothetical protein
VTVNKAFAATASAAALAAVGIGLYLGGSPAEQRLLRIDEERLNGLRTLAQAIDAHWIANRTLPSDMNRLIDAQRLRMPVDPVSEAPYEYEILGADRYRLCATFDRPSPDVGVPDFWRHDAGRRCFDIEPRGLAR